MRQRSELFRRFFLSYMLIFLFPVCVLGILGIVQINRNHQKEQLALQTVTLEKDIEILNFELEKFNHLTAAISTYDELSPSQRARSSNFPYKIMRFLGEQVYSSLLVNGIYIVFPEDHRVYTDIGVFNYEIFFQEYFLCKQHTFQELEGLWQQEIPFFIDDVYSQRSSERRTVVYSHPLQGINAGEGYILYTVDYQKLRDLYSFLPEGIDIYTAVAKGSTLFFFDFPFWEDATRFLAQTEEKQLLNDQSYYRIAASSPESGVTMVRLVSKAMTINARTSSRWSAFLIGLLILCWLGALCVSLLSRAVYRPILRLAQTANLLAGENSSEKNELRCAEQAIIQLHEQYGRSQRDSMLLSLLHTEYHSLEELERSPARVVLGWAGYCVCILEEKNPAALVEKLRSICSVADTTALGNDRHVLLFSLSQQQLPGFGEHLLKKVSNIPGFGHIGIGRIYTDPLKISTSYHQAQNAFQTSVKNGYPALYDTLDTPSTIEKFPQDEVNTLFQAIVSRNAGQAESISQSILQSLREEKISMLFGISLCYHLINRCVSALQQAGLDSTVLVQKHSQFFVSPSSHPFGELLEIAESICRDIVAALRENTPAASGPIQEVLTYIHQNYQNSNLTVKLIAMEHKMSVSNLSHQFKNSMGVNLSEYIDLLRLTQARQLLTQTDTTIEAIAQECGFGSSVSLIRKIRRYYGMTPTEYRNL